MFLSTHRSLVTRAAVVALAASLFAGSAVAQDDKVVATLNGEEITEADIAMAQQELGQQFAQLPEDQRRAAALSAIIDVRVFANAAEEQGLDEDEEFKSRMEFLRQRALHSAYIENTVMNEITDEAVRARYDKQISEMKPVEEVRARHILVETEEEAKEIIKQLDDGGDFAEIAKEKSKDGAAAEGGDLGYFTKGRMVPEFEEAAFGLEAGSYSKEPIKTQFGFHVIKVEDKRNQQPPAFEQVQNQFRSVVFRDLYVEQLAKLRGDANVEIEDEALKGQVDTLLRQQLGQAEPEAEGEKAE
ncbi:peptidylprolyl isomerase [Nitratireductor sp. CH_MIT9313-5]|jgi:peptidyl-prolyl cis-trans isomerase C|uniref:peptidylprolyl isomerase n=1 Tax=Nitratireductor sp. CH_MIT9313-5 TaxID=3107764 RepID=UPI003008D659